MLRRIEMIDLPAKRRLLHKYCAAASFFSSDESAKAQPAAQQEEEQRLTQHRQPQALAQGHIPPVDVLLGAGANAGFTGDAFPAAQAGFLQLRANGSTGSRANTAPMGQRN